MAEQHDADREPQPIDEDAAWAAIVAGYGDEPADPPGAKPFKSVDGLALLEGGTNSTGGGQEPDGSSPDKGSEKHPENGAEKTADQPRDGGADGGTDEVRPPLGGSVIFAPGVGSPVAGPRDYAPAEESDDEGHFVPPEPPPLPEADVTSKFAWLGVVGGPVLMLVAVLLQWDMTWWLTTICVGGFLGGFATLVARMSHGDEEDDDPGRGAVV
ncbi:hypothetical protein [Streptomyces liangshanensis]|uniref:DUF308 domain-containing protein n=1 Tax=Streptomyces liangshanensis TaxID=2717324 RepID=A0A6G9H3R2_9ACTN|nr:hypothetical protein [Streptomyces liangshanensis]QIQ05178.1 hypothetical protein HA039_25455 [Streptomyces liangshanensis]